MATLDHKVVRSSTILRPLFCLCLPLECRWNISYGKVDIVFEPGSARALVAHKHCSGDETYAQWQFEVLHEDGKTLLTAMSSRSDGTAHRTWSYQVGGYLSNL